VGRSGEVFEVQTCIELRKPACMRESDLHVSLKTETGRVPEHGVRIIRQRDTGIPHAGSAAVGFNPKEQGRRFPELCMRRGREAARQEKESS